MKKQITTMLLMAAMFISVGCTAEESEGKPGGKGALAGTEWVYHFEGTDTIMGLAFTRVNDYTLQFETDSTGMYLVDGYVVIDGTSQSSNSQMGIRYTFDGRTGVISFVFPDGTPSYVRTSMPDQKFTYDAQRQELTWVELPDPSYEEKYGKMIFRPKK